MHVLKLVRTIQDVAENGSNVVFFKIEREVFLDIVIGMFIV